VHISTPVGDKTITVRVSVKAGLWTGLWTGLLIGLDSLLDCRTQSDQDDTNQCGKQMSPAMIGC